MWNRIRRTLPAVSERALKTFAQTLASIIITMGAVSVSDVDWWQALSAAGLAALMSVLTSVASWKLGSEPGPSINGSEANVESLPVATELVVDDE